MESGRPEKTGIDKEILTILRNDGFLSINQISKKLKYGWQTIEKRLNVLENEWKVIQIRHKRIRLFSKK